MAKIPEKPCTDVARRVGMSPRAVQRILGGIAINEQALAGAKKEAARVFRISISLADCGIRPEHFYSENLKDGLVEMLSEYRRCCPRVVRWLASGDFNPGKPPSLISAGDLLHANRTVGRVRAELLRNFLSF